MKIKIFFAALIISIFNIILSAQTPIVLTLKASGVSSTETPEGSPNLSVSATLNGAVNANGTNCTVSFEYGNTTSYGNTIAASPGTVTGNGDNAVNAAVTINYTDTGPQERLIHYRVKVTNENGTYYGRDFVANPIFLMRDFGIYPTCSDHSTRANYDLTNNNGSADFIIDYVSGTYSWSAVVGSRQVQQIFVDKGAICSFYYNNTITRQIITNDQTCSEQPATWTKVFMSAVGTVGPGNQSQLFKVENANAGAVTLQVVIGSEIYNQVVPGNTVVYFAGDYAEATFTCDGIEFAYASPTNYQYEGMSWLAVNAISSTLDSASFELYNRDAAPHTFILRNSGGTEYSYTLTPYEARNITLSNENWDVYTSVTDFTWFYYPPSELPATFQTYGKTSLCYNGYLKVATAVPGTSLTPSVSSVSFASSTSLTLNGAIANSAFSSADVDYHFIYGTDPANLNQSTTAQSGTVPVNGSLEVSATVTGLTQETLYYYKLVMNETTSASGKIFLSTAIPATNLKLHLRSDLAVTSSSSAVSSWGDVSGFNNDATQNTAANQPGYDTGYYNGKSVIAFYNDQKKMLLPTSTALGIQNNPYEFFIVAFTGVGNVEFLIAGASLEQFEYHLSGPDGLRFIPTTSTYLDYGTVPAYDNAHIFSARASASGGTVRVDGIDGGTTNANILSANGGNLILGARSDNTYYFDGGILEVIIYNSVLSSTDRNTVEQYLADRYGITSGALPVELTSFIAANDNGNVVLHWQTATEVNNYGFEVERTLVIGHQSLDSIPIGDQRWEKIGFVQGSGNSNSPKQYSFVDENPPARNLKYRLKQIDTDGQFEYYSTRAEVNLSTTGVEEKEIPKEFALLQNYPNPFNPVTVISWQLPVGSWQTLKVYDVLGNEVATLVDEQKAPGNYEVKFDGSRLASGTYIYRLKADNFSQTRKLLLMK